jgi:hypothetical protein
MFSLLIESGLVVYTVLQVFVAFIAVLFSLKWNKHEFLPGLIFLFIYAFVDMIDMVYFTVVHGVFYDLAQFGFILLAILFFIVGMHPTYSPKMVPGRRKRNIGHRSRRESLISQLRRG